KAAARTQYPKGITKHAGLGLKGKSATDEIKAQVQKRERRGIGLHPSNVRRLGPSPPQHTQRPLWSGKRAAVAGEDLVKFGDRRARALRVRPDRADDREKIGAGFDQWSTILLRDAADRTARHDCRLTPILEQLRGRSVLCRGLGHAREERAEGD